MLSKATTALLFTAAMASIHANPEYSLGVRGAPKDPSRLLQADTCQESTTDSGETIKRFDSMIIPCPAVVGDYVAVAMPFKMPIFESSDDPDLLASISFSLSLIHI